MINDLASSFTSEFAALARRSAHGPSSRLGARDARWRGVNREYERLGFTSTAEPGIGSLWSPGLLDRLRAPLTRYHE